ncbi:MAG: gamma-butyrobetaine hydroxylase-like domain-containing protein [Chloroflexota bacterium]
MSDREAYAGIAPVSIEGNPESKSMKVTWNDGHVSQLTYEWLRWHCPCATCAGEGASPGILSFTKALAPEQTDLRDLQLVGSYAMSPLWGDGHQTGIYAFRYLRSICPCPECEARRKSQEGQAS